MKWIFLAGLFVLTPMLVAFFRGHRNHLPKAAFVLGLMPFIEVGFNVSASPIAWPTWPGTAKGIELSLTDSVAIAMVVAGSRLKTPVGIKLSFGLFLFAFLVSLAGSDAKMPAMFYGWNLGRTVLVFLAVARASVADRNVPIALLTGLITGLGIQAVVVSWEYAGGARQAGGWFGHQNLLGMATHLIAYPAFAAFLGGYYPKRTAVAVVAGLVVAFAGGSRATIGLFALGVILTAMLSLLHRPSGRKAGIVAAALIGLLAASPFLYSAIERRSDESRAGSNDERQKMVSAASMIIADYPFGIGANHYVIVANLGGYSARANVAWNEANRAAPVHNTYYLVTAEMGWLGLLGLMAIIGTVLHTALRTTRQIRHSFAGEYAAGVTISFLVLAVHAYFEWITMTYPIHLLFGMNLGVLVAIGSSAAHPRSTLLLPDAPAHISMKTVQGEA